MFVEKCNYLNLKGVMNLSSLLGAVWVWFEITKTLQQISIYFFCISRIEATKEKGKDLKVKMKITTLLKLMVE